MARLINILVVDDEEGIRNLLFDVLSNEGFKVTLAKDGMDSLNHMRKRRFDLLIADVNMPRLDGIGLLKKMKKAGRKEKVILMTGNPVNKVFLNEDTQPVITLLEKPFRIHHILNVISSALTKQNRRRDGKTLIEMRNKSTQAYPCSLN
ncbi:MAG: response regulator [Deltaproteobacteria bacterium]|nr:response regulator [Deltaproteobacteria bacterium]